MRRWATRKAQSRPWHEHSTAGQERIPDVILQRKPGRTAHIRVRGHSNCGLTDRTRRHHPLLLFLFLFFRLHLQSSAPPLPCPFLSAAHQQVPAGALFSRSLFCHSPVARPNLAKQRSRSRKLHGRGTHARLCRMLAFAPRPSPLKRARGKRDTAFLDRPSGRLAQRCVAQLPTLCLPPYHPFPP